AFTLIDLCVVLVVVVVLLAMAPAILFRVEGESQKSLCSRNLSAIGDAMRQYALMNNGSFPRTRCDRKSSVLTQYTGANSPDSFAANGPAANDVTASIFLLMKTIDLPPKLFICPNSGADPTIRRYTGRFRRDRISLPRNASATACRIR